MRVRILLSLLLLVALPLTASMQVEPATPTSATPVTLRIQGVASCTLEPTVSRSGAVFTLDLGSIQCLAPPAPYSYAVALGKLAPGDYQVAVTLSGARIDYGGFFVSDADAGLSFTGPTIGLTTGGNILVLNNPSDFVNCFSADQDQCPLPTINFDGRPAIIDKALFAKGIVQVLTPAHPQGTGIANVKIFGTKANRSGYVFRYYDGTEGPLPSMFERVLVPVYLFASGAFGSQWVTDLTILNSGANLFEPYRLAPQPFYPAGKAVPINFGQSRPAGALFFVPRENSSTVSFGSVARDVSRSATDAGTEIHVARESDFRTGTISLLGIPIDPHFRNTLRIYGVDSVNDVATVRLYPMDSATPLATRLVALTSAQPCNRFEPCASDEPAFMIADLQTLFPELAGQSKVRIDIVSSSRMWALATVTNNETQHLTAITPQ